jgi:hypothetical protein
MRSVFWKVIIGGLVIVVAVVAAVVAFVGRGESSVLGAPPTFSALSNGQAVPAVSLPSDVERFINLAAPDMGMTPATASTRVHLIRSSMGAAGLDMYAFADNVGRPCFDVPTEGGTCDSDSSDSQTATPGFYWLLGGGDGGNAPSYLIGIAGDNVQTITLTIDGNDVPVSLQKNVAFTEFPNTAKNATITVQYTNGDEKSDSLALS